MGDDNPPRAGRVRIDRGRIHALHQQGITTAADIARALNEQGVTTPKGERWHAMQVQRFLLTGTTKSFWRQR